LPNSRTDSELRWALSYLTEYRARLAVLALLSTAEIALRVLSPWPLKAIVDSVFGAMPMVPWLAGVAAALPGSAPGDRAHLLFFIVTIGLLIQFAHQLVLMLHGRLQVSTSQRLVRHVRAKLFTHLQALALAHHVNTPTGDAVHRLEADARALDQIVFRGVFPFVFSFATLVVMFGVLIRINVPLALLSISVVPPLYVWLRYYTRRMRPAADRARELDSRLAERLYESFSTIRLIKTHAREDFESERFAGIARENMEAWISVGRRSTRFAIVVAMLTIVGSSLVLLFGGLAVLQGRVTLGTLLLVLAYLGFVYGPLSAIANTTNEMQQAFASARRVRSAFALAPEASDAPNAVRAINLRGDVQFEHVGFAYEPGRPVVEDVTMSAKSGQMIALVGPSGSGKSTLVSLLPRIYEPAAGRVMVDGRDVREYQLRSLRQSVALVLQEAVMMSGTAQDNIRYGRLTASDAEVEAAARAANAHDFIMALPRGYFADLGEAGGKLSGGQKQRLSIARAFLKDAPILILDEPTAALDALSEELVMEALDRLRAGRTTFVIAHRLTTVQQADCIYVLDRGRIVAHGSHEELLRTCQLYRDLCRRLAPTTMS
jgi:ATP-binding cassette subfamily B protein/subfamily B ATP-binding cassette protein MsbA